MSTKLTIRENDIVRLCSHILHRCYDSGSNVAQTTGKKVKMENVFILLLRKQFSEKGLPDVSSTRGQQTAAKLMYQQFITIETSIAIKLT